MDIKIGERLFEYRKFYGYSQEELSEKLNVSRQTISNWERGEASPDTESLIRLAKIYGVSVDDLINVDKPLNKSNKKTNSSENKNESKVDIDFGPFHIHTSDTSESGKKESVTIDKDGVTIEDAEDSVTVDAEHIYKPHFERYSFKQNKVANLVSLILGTLIIAAYLIVGFLVKDGFSLYWPILFMLLAVSGPTIRDLIQLKFVKFPIIFPVLTVYLIIGMVLGLWHPGWLLFLIVPLYHSLCKTIRDLKKKDYE